MLRFQRLFPEWFSVGTREPARLLVAGRKKQSNHLWEKSENSLSVVVTEAEPELGGDILGKRQLMSQRTDPCFDIFLSHLISGQF